MLMSSVNRSALKCGSTNTYLSQLETSFSSSSSSLSLVNDLPPSGTQVLMSTDMG